MKAPSVLSFSQFDTFSAVLLSLICATAPWVVGSRATDPRVWWSFAFLILGLAAVRAVIHLTRKTIPVLEKPEWWVLGVLAAALVWWAFTPEPAFGTAFAAEHWGFMIHRQPEGVLEVSRQLRVCLTGAVLCAAVMAFELGCSRRRAGWIVAGIAFGGVFAALFSWAQSKGWTHSPRWLLAGYGGPDRFDGPYYHYSVAASALNVAWPLLCFVRSPRRSILLLRVGASVTVGLLCLRLWPAETCQLLAVALLGAGLGYLALSKFQVIGARLIWRLTMGAIVLTALAQAGSLVYLSRHHDDGWSSAAETAVQAPERDRAIQAKAFTRGDRLVASERPARPVAWLTAFRMASDHLVLGPGPGSWPRLSVLYSNDPLINTFYHHRQFAHHDFLQTAAQSGLVVALALLWVWLEALRRTVSNLQGRVELGVFVALLALTFQSCWHFPLQLPVLQLWAAVLVGVGWASTRRAASDRSERLNAEGAVEG